MGIKETLGRLESGKISPREKRLKPVDHNSYSDQVLDEGTRMFFRARVYGLLGELKALLEEGDPDCGAEITEAVLYGNGEVGVSLRWDVCDFAGNKLTKVKTASQQSFLCRFVLVCARPLTQELVVQGKEREVLRKYEWEDSDQEILALAIVDAYRSRATAVGSGSPRLELTT